MNDYHDNPLIIVIFGITGDLAERKLLPAIHFLKSHDSLPEKFRIVGISRQDVPVSDVYASLLASGDDPIAASALMAQTEMLQLDIDNEADYRRLYDRLQELSRDMGPGVSRMYYLSIPAQAFEPVVSHLGATGHNEPFADDIFRPRLLVEKPFGHDTASAQHLIDVACEHFGEQQTFRIDHYLARETAQNILTFRFKNPLFESIWNDKHIESIRVFVHETLGIENRAYFYEHTGALRDIIQSHLLQVLALVTMEKPAHMESADIHRAKLRLFDSIRAIETDEVATHTQRGQYDGYRAEVDNAHSVVETFARLSLTIDNAQWRKTAVTLETGKGLDEKLTEVVVQFRADEDMGGEANALIFRLQPREGITLLLQAKQPGIHNDMETVEMDFDYARSFMNRSIEAYARVIVDAIRDDQSLFASSAEVMSSWRIIENVIQAWSKNDHGLAIYPVGTAARDISPTS